MIIVDCEQGSPEWHSARLGCPTASKFGEIITPVKMEYSKSAEKYMLEKVFEKLTGKSAENGYTNQHMERGTELEAEARAWYEISHGDVQQVGIVYRDERRDVACSPDGLTEIRGLEIKCPSPAVMVKILLAKAMPIEYIPQVQGSMWITGLKEWNFLAYHPDLDPFLVTVHRDDKFCSTLEMYIHRFNTELNATYSKLRRPV